MVDYITFVAHDTGMNEMKNYGFDVSGTIMELPFGPLGLAFGIEHRKEEGKYDPDAFIAAGFYLQVMPQALLLVNLRLMKVILN
ncbi:MAG: hypothetical protein CM15mP29_0440 [Alphaproteobacteria bacterium]|nr:MAG: hypothetical protein CM15mP29_0440 [Alphaproteobacteria bacterium]